MLECEGSDCQRGDPEEDSLAVYIGSARKRPRLRVGPGNNTQAWVALYSATARVSDKPAPPTLEPLNTSRAGLARAVSRVVVSAVDASGVAVRELRAGATELGRRQQSCDYSRMQPCPASARGRTVDTSKVADGTYDLKASAVDAARQQGTTRGVLRVDANAPAAPSQLGIARNADGTLALSGPILGQGTAAPIVGAACRCVPRVGVTSRGW